MNHMISEIVFMNHLSLPLRDLSFLSVWLIYNHLYIIEIYFNIKFILILKFHQSWSTRSALFMNNLFWFIFQWNFIYNANVWAAMGIYLGEGGTRLPTVWWIYSSYNHMVMIYTAMGVLSQYAVSLYIMFLRSV